MVRNARPRRGRHWIDTDAVERAKAHVVFGADLIGEHADVMIVDAGQCRDTEPRGIGIDIARVDCSAHEIAHRFRAAVKPRSRAKASKASAISEPSEMVRRCIGFA